MVKSIDRLCRNYHELLEQWRIITKEKKAAVVVLDMPPLDTRQGRDLTGTLIADIVLRFLSCVAQTEREFIHQRQAEGIAAARERGVQFGRKPLPKPEEFSSLCAAWKIGAILARKASERPQVSHKDRSQMVQKSGKCRKRIGRAFLYVFFFLLPLLFLP